MSCLFAPKSCLSVPVSCPVQQKRSSQKACQPYYRAHRAAWQYRGQVMRVLFTAQDQQTIRDAFGQAKPNTEYARLAQEAPDPLNYESGGQEFDAIWVSARCTSTIASVSRRQ